MYDESEPPLWRENGFGAISERSAQYADGEEVDSRFSNESYTGDGGIRSLLGLGKERNSHGK